MASPPIDADANTNAANATGAVGGTAPPPPLGASLGLDDLLRGLDEASVFDLDLTFGPTPTTAVVATPAHPSPYPLLPTLPTRGVDTTNAPTSPAAP
ncbi:hypothetical protein HK405_006101, partial [Cladochytrium tenue]